MAVQSLNNKHYELGIGAKQRDPSQPVKIFIASPSDVRELRDETEKLISEEYNDRWLKDHGKLRFQPFRWETHMQAGYVGKDIQKHIFEKFGDWCDIFLLLFWGKLGSGGTEQEYDKFVNRFRAINPDISFWALVYNKPVFYEQVNTDELERLRSFLSQNRDDWVEIGSDRGSVQSLEDYKTELRKLLNSYEIPS